mmetsp:Transcript_38392/g.110974  ORF Transcript_38392/g.110974 Transcript_38392/m.110974 type:complete len:283 (+) Transcript_38392:81-929(+)
MIAHTPGTWRLLYFNAPNRGEQVRMLFFLSKTVFDDVRLAPYPEGLDPYKKAALGDDSPLLGTDKVPAVTAPDGTHCVETSEIMRFVGQSVGLAPPSGSAEDEKAMEMTLLIQDVMNGVFYGLLKPLVVKRVVAVGCIQRLINGKESAYLEQPTTKLAQALQKIEATLEASGGPYLLGAQLCYADVSLFAILREVLAFDCFDRAELLSRHAKLAALLQDLERKTKPWIEWRVREHQLGIDDAIQYFAATNTPMPWAKKADRKTTDCVRTDPAVIMASGDLAS